MIDISTYTVSGRWLNGRKRKSKNSYTTGCIPQKAVWCGQEQPKSMSRLVLALAASEWWVIISKYKSETMTRNQMRSTILSRQFEIV